jgi:hypothetical protein
MSKATRKIRQVLESEYGIDRGFTGHLAPLLERFAAKEPSAEEWADFVEGLAAAYRAAQRRQGPPHEVKVLMGEVAAELRKIEESIKVLSVYLLRIHRSVQTDADGPMIH